MELLGVSNNNNNNNINNSNNNNKFINRIPGNISINIIKKIALLGTAHMLRRILSIK